MLRARVGEGQGELRGRGHCTGEGGSKGGRASKYYDVGLISEKLTLQIVNSGLMGVKRGGDGGTNGVDFRVVG